MYIEISPFCLYEITRSVFALQIEKQDEFDDVFQSTDISVWRNYPYERMAYQRRQSSNRSNAKTEVQRSFL